MKRLVAVALLAGLVAVPVAHAGPAAPVLAIVDHSQYGQDGTLVRYDAATLRPLPGPTVHLGAFEDAWSFSADGGKLVFGFANPSCVGGETSLRFVDAARMRAAGDVPLLPNGNVEATDWLDATHVLAVVQSSNCVNENGTVIFDVDAATRRVTSRTSVAGDVIGLARAPGRLVLLVSPRNRIGVASLAVVDAGGSLHRVGLGGLEGGTTLSQVIAGSSTIPHMSVPGLAVGGGDAFVVPASGPVAEVDLATLRVTRHSLRETRSLAKGATGPLRTAVWLPNGVLAVSGWNFGRTAGRPGATPAGLELVDTRTWRFRTIDTTVSRVQVAGGVLFASSLEGSELTAFSLDGKKHYRRAASAFWFMGTLGSRGYAGLGRRIVGFDFHTGAVGRAVPYFGQLLLGANAPFTVGGI